MRLAFARDCDIYVAHPSGSDLVNVTDGVAECTSRPTLSSSGRYVAYMVQPAIWIYDIATGSRTRLTDNGLFPDFSPTSDTVAFTRQEARGGAFEVVTLNVDGTGSKNWTANTSAGGLSANPQWSADGQSLLFSNNQGVRSCEVDFGDYQNVYYASRLARVTPGGEISTLAGSDDSGVIFGHEGGGVLAYTRSPLPPMGEGNLCQSAPATVYQLVVNGAEIGEVDDTSVSVNPAGDVAFSNAGKVRVDPAGAEGPQILFDGTNPDWGTAYIPAAQECTIDGTEGDDRLVGTDGPDIICGYGGNDYLFGMGGDDVLRGGEGEDDLIGGTGDDLLEGGLDADALRGEEGDDILDGGEGIDLVTYFTIRKKVTVDLGRQTARSAPHGKDTLRNIEGAFGSKTGDVLIGSPGSNHLSGGPGKDKIRGMGGTDLLHGNAGKDVIKGGGGGDMLFGDGGKDTLKGGSSRDVCYDTSAKRSSCEYDEKDDPKRGGKPPKKGRKKDADAPVPVPVTRTGGGARWWNLGKNDYLIVYNARSTQNLGYWAGTGAAWEKGVCRVIRYTAARGACTASNALQAVSKYQMRWFLWNAKRNGGCAIAILDWGRHGVNQFQKRWKVRSADYYRYNVAIPALTPGRTTYVKTSNGGSIGVGCS